MAQRAGEQPEGLVDHVLAGGVDLAGGEIEGLADFFLRKHQYLVVDCQRIRAGRLVEPVKSRRCLKLVVSLRYGREQSGSWITGITGITAGLSPTKIAREMGISRGTVYKAKAEMLTGGEIIEG